MKAVALLLLALALGQSSPLEGDVPYPDPVQSLTEVPKTPDISDCVCPAGADAADVTLKGIVVDAKIIPGADLRSYEDRMATIFDVTWSTDGAVAGRTEVWHNISEKSCGVAFDYGKQYTVNARRGDDGALQTDACLMGW